MVCTAFGTNSIDKNDLQPASFNNLNHERTYHWICAALILSSLAPTILLGLNKNISHLICLASKMCNVHHLLNFWAYDKIFFDTATFYYRSFFCHCVHGFLYTYAPPRIYLPKFLLFEFPLLSPHIIFSGPSSAPNLFAFLQVGIFLNSWSTKSMRWTMTSL